MSNKSSGYIYISIYSLRLFVSIKSKSSSIIERLHTGDIARVVVDLMWLCCLPIAISSITSD